MVLLKPGWGYEDRITGILNPDGDMKRVGCIKISGII